MSPSFAPPCVAALYERGPWRTRETFGGDELANINRYNLWPDPLLNPRTVREQRPTSEARAELFCPVPQMVGGGTVHWQGWLPRFTEKTSGCAASSATCPATTLADWPITYDDLEPYYAKVEWAFGVSGQAGANAFESRRSKGYPCPPMPLSRYAQKFHKGCAKLGWNSFPTPQAALSRPFNGRPATVISAFAQQHGDPTGTRSSALNVFIPDAVATGRLRPAAGTATSARLGVDGQGARSGPRSTPTRTATRSSRRPTSSSWPAARSSRPGCCCCRIRPLPQRPRQRQRPGRPQRHLPRVQRRCRNRSTIRSTPGPAAATSARAVPSSTSTTTAAGFVSGGHIACAGVGIPLPINWRLPDRPAWGAEAKTDRS